MLLLPSDILDDFLKGFQVWKEENLPQEKVPDINEKALDVLENLPMLINLTRVIAQEVIDFICRIRKPLKGKVARKDLAKSLSLFRSKPR